MSTVFLFNETNNKDKIKEGVFNLMSNMNIKLINYDYY